MAAPLGSSSAPNVPDVSKSSDEVKVIFRDVDVEEKEKVKNFCKRGCDCFLGPLDASKNKTPCCTWFNEEEVSYRRDQCLEMSSISSVSLEAYIMGHFSSLETKGQRIKLTLGGRRVCLKTFAFLMGLCKSKVQNLHAHFLKNGFTQRVHKSVGKPAKNPYNRDMQNRREGIKLFLENMINKYGSPIPGKVASPNDWSSFRFPSHWNKEILFKRYIQSCIDQGYTKYCSKNTFKTHWKVMCPQIDMMERRRDFCQICHNNADQMDFLIKESVVRNPLDDMTLNIKDDVKEHFYHMQTEQSNYNMRLDYARKNRESMSLLTLNFSEPMSIPFLPLQSQKNQSNSLFKVNLFAIENEGLQTSHIYMFDEAEAETCKKGANCIASLLFHEIANTPKVPHLAMQFDNCGDQIKNYTMIGFLAYMVMCGYFNELTVHFHVESHSVFSADHSFDIISKSYQKKEIVECLEDLVDVVDGASHYFSAIPSTKNGCRVVDWYDWRSFIDQFFRPLKGLKKYHAFTFKSNTPGIVDLKEWSNSPETMSLSLLKCEMSPQDLPLHIPENFKLEKNNLPKDRIEYLLKNAVPLVSNNAKRHLLLRSINSQSDTPDTEMNIDSAFALSMYAEALLPPSPYDNTSMYLADDSPPGSSPVSIHCDEDDSDSTMEPEEQSSTSHLASSSSFADNDDTPSVPSESEAVETPPPPPKSAKKGAKAARCQECQECLQYKKFKNNEVKKCRKCKHCTKRHKQMCKKFICSRTE
ncbi:uncharacterized protein [Lepeophtheirus salmonis]|uniref:Putative LOC582807 [Strongylocentrotus purpuratus] n=1 Tax=Lepeophtheirus salmonis TaxID=72036 RepID=A0A0K2U060_LEPSM|nr:uncharacterized protein LOC121129504 [Lepeophtheirus salmonis]